MRTILTGSSLFVVIALCIVIHASIVSTNMRDREVSNGLEMAADYAVDKMDDLYNRIDFDIDNQDTYIVDLLQTFCDAMKEKINTDGEISVRLIKADIENSEFDIFVVEEYKYPFKGKKGSCSCERAFILGV